MPKIPDSVCIS